jgi:hypothetical protein
VDSVCHTSFTKVGLSSARVSSAIKQGLDAKEYDWELHVAGIVCRLDSSFIFAVPRLRRIQEQSQYSVLG